jgi:3-carboxy-cis,cis-muconate cycloisomerase
MRANIERQRGTVFAEAAAALLAPTLGKTKAQALLARLSARAIADDADLRTLLRADPALASVAAGALDAAFDIDTAARQAGSVATAQLDRLAERAAAMETSDDH